MASARSYAGSESKEPRNSFISVRHQERRSSSPRTRSAGLMHAPQTSSNRPRALGTRAPWAGLSKAGDIQREMLGAKSAASTRATSPAPRWNQAEKASAARDRMIGNRALQGGSEARSSCWTPARRRSTDSAAAESDAGFRQRRGSGQKSGAWLRPSGIDIGTRGRPGNLPSTGRYHARRRAKFLCALSGELMKLARSRTVGAIGCGKGPRFGNSTGGSGGSRES